MKQAELRIRLKSQAQLERIKKAARSKEQSLQKFGFESIFQIVDKTLSDDDAAKSTPLPQSFEVQQ